MSRTISLANSLPLSAVDIVTQIEHRLHSAHFIRTRTAKEASLIKKKKYLNLIRVMDKAQ